MKSTDRKNSRIKLRRLRDRLMTEFDRANFDLLGLRKLVLPMTLGSRCNRFGKSGTIHHRPALGAHTYEVARKGRLPRVVTGLNGVIRALQEVN